MTDEQEFQEEFAELDLDGDGSITRDEFLSRINDSIPKEGASQEELTYYQKAVAMLMREFDQYDLNGDGQISREEFFAVRREMVAVSDDYREFLEWDKDGSGYLWIAELPATPEHATGVPHSEIAERYQRRMALLKEYDLDGDGRVQLDEFLAARKRARIEARQLEQASS